MKFYLTEYETFDDEVGEYLIFAGPIIPAPTQQMAEEILKKNNYFNFYVVGYFISTMSFDPALENFNNC